MGIDGICAVVMCGIHVSIHKCECVTVIELTSFWHTLMKALATSHYASVSIKMFRDHSQIHYVWGTAIHTHLSLTVSWQSLWQLYRLLHYPEATLLKHSHSIKICAYAYILNYTSYMWCLTVKAVWQLWSKSYRGMFIAHVHCVLCVHKDLGAQTDPPATQDLFTIWTTNL